MLSAFQKSRDPKADDARSRQIRHEAELEKVIQDAAAAVAWRDKQLEEKERQIEQPTTRANTATDSATEVDTLVQYVIARCGSVEHKIREVIDGLTAYLEQRS